MATQVRLGHPRGAAHLVEDDLDALREPAEVVAALEDGGESAAAARIGDVHEHPGEHPETGRRDFHAAQGVPEVDVEPRREQNHLGHVLVRQGLENPPEDPQVLRIAGSGLQGDVDRVALPVAASDLLKAPRPGVVRVLVGRKIQDPGVFVERVLGPVAVVQVPVHDEDPLHPVDLDRMHGPDGDVVEDAEPRRAACLGMVARRPHEGKGVAQVALDDAVHTVEEAAHGQLGHLVGLGGGLRVGIEVGVILPRRLGDHLHVRVLVDRLDLFVQSYARFHLREFPCHLGAFEHLVDRFETLRAFGVVMAGFMTEVPVILYDSSGRCHRRPLGVEIRRKPLPHNTLKIKRIPLRGRPKALTMGVTKAI